MVLHVLETANCAILQLTIMWRIPKVYRQTTQKENNSGGTSLMALLCPWSWRLASPGQGPSDPFVTLFRGDRTFLVSASSFLAGRNPMSHLLDKCFTSLVIWEKNRSCIYSSIYLERKCKWQFFNSGQNMEKLGPSPRSWFCNKAFRG